MTDVAAAFSRSYGEARQKFLQAAADAGLQVESKPHPLPGRHGEPLAMDVAREGDPGAARLLIVSSGCHGVEGYCGSGVQVTAMRTCAQALRQTAWRSSTSTP
jgi:hypothetical protein